MKHPLIHLGVVDCNQFRVPQPLSPLTGSNAELAATIGILERPPNRSSQRSWIKGFGQDAGDVLITVLWVRLRTWLSGCSGIEVAIHSKTNTRTRAINESAASRDS